MDGSIELDASFPVCSQTITGNGAEEFTSIKPETSTTDETPTLSTQSNKEFTENNDQTVIPPETTCDNNNSDPISDIQTPASVNNNFAGDTPETTDMPNREDVPEKYLSVYDAVMTLAQSDKFSSMMNTPPPPPPCFERKTTRKELSLKEKVEVINASDGKSQRQLAQQFNVCKSQVHNILKRKNEILETSACGFLENTERKRRFIKTGNEEINILTLEWYTRMKDGNINVTGGMLQRKAREFAQQLGKVDFKASNGWLESFRRRHKIGAVMSSPAVSSTTPSSGLEKSFPSRYLHYPSYTEPPPNNLGSDYSQDQMGNYSINSRMISDYVNSYDQCDSNVPGSTVYHNHINNNNNQTDGMLPYANEQNMYDDVCMGSRYKK